MQRRWLCHALAMVGVALALSVATGCGDDDDDSADIEPCAACPSDCSCVAVVGDVIDLPSPAHPADTPGSPGVTVAGGSKLAVQFGTSGVDLNRTRYTRYALGVSELRPDAILVLVPGFDGGAADFKILAEEVLPRALAERDLVVELWAFDRRTDQLEDREGLRFASRQGDAQLALDWLFGAELGLPLSPGLSRRAVFYNTTNDIPFLANWTPLMFSRDIDTVVESARATARNANVFVGGHSAGTGFAARYASTDFDLDGSGPPEPGYAKVRGLLLFEGGGGSAAGDPPASEVLDRIEAKFDGGLYAAVRDGAPRCTDGTPCAVASEAVDCGHLDNPRCTPPVAAYAEVAGLLNPYVLASVEPAAIQGRSDPDGGQIILQVAQNNVPGNTAVARVPGLSGLTLLPQATVYGGIGAFVDDDGVVASLASFVATSLGQRGPAVAGLQTWFDIDEPVPANAFTNNGPPPIALPVTEPWGIEQEPTRFDRFLTLLTGETNFIDWYYASSGLSVTAGLPGLDSSALSLDPPAGRGRRDIENLTQAANIDVPVICFGGSNGLTRTPASFAAFARTIGTCTAPGCDGSTPRLIDANHPNPAFPTFGGAAGGFEVYISEGYAHVDVLTAEAGPGNLVIAPLIDFVARHSEP
ncbi:MAG TPA: hypothetical protein VEB21_13280 [Terriglobales bacterium]|nr:hypothetical protein [Terriglobales bacterium]